MFVFKSIRHLCVANMRNSKPQSIITEAERKLFLTCGATQLDQWLEGVGVVHRVTNSDFTSHDNRDLYKLTMQACAVVGYVLYTASSGELSRDVWYETPVEKHLSTLLPTSSLYSVPG